MDSDVRDVFNAHQHEEEANGRKGVTTWEEFIRMLEERYAPARDAEEAANEFYKTKMAADETMDAFLSRVSAIVNRIAKEDLPTTTATEVVLRMLDERRYPDLLRTCWEDQRKHKLGHNGRGMEFLTLRNRLPELARVETSRDIRGDFEALKADLLRLLQAAGTSLEAGEPTEEVEVEEEDRSAIERLNAVEFRSFMEETDEELKKKGWSPKKIKALREGGCFRCLEKGHLARDCTNPRA
jgi:hypothetical protein